GFRFRDVPILAKKTAHVAARRAERKHSRAGQEVVQWLFLDRIDLQRCRRSISKTVELPSMIGTDEAEAGLAFPNVAMVRAEIAMHAAFSHGLPPAGLVKVMRLLKYFQFLHGGLRRENLPRT